jgi:CTD small phosphatase-like protein 2
LVKKPVFIDVPHVVANVYLPAIPHASSTKHKFSYTLVLDLDETLVHFDVSRRIFKVRPLCIRFLEELSPLYEIVIFTAAHESYANFILDKLDPGKQHIRHRLYRQHTIPYEGSFIKDLSRLGRPLERTLIIDNLKENFVKQQDNGIECSTWTGSVNDRQLFVLMQFLLQMHAQQPRDIRPHIA